MLREMMAVILCAGVCLVIPLPDMDTKRKNFTDKSSHTTTLKTAKMTRILRITKLRLSVTFFIIETVVFVEQHPYQGLHVVLQKDTLTIYVAAKICFLS